MNPQIAQNAYNFLLRVQLTGNEVPAFNAVMASLEGEINKPIQEIAQENTPPSPESSDT